ncbi:helix-turn-helix transcriptional regulator [Streptomyces termitum]|uniref:helix-turn-helix transcriptional regulator n=1 Tax=Streptomyces termitum TaxID=67368 RepID=UPI0033BD349E
MPPLPTPSPPRSPQKSPPAEKPPPTRDRSGPGRPLLTPGAWYSTRELAVLLRVDPSTLRRWRTSRPPRGPAFVSFSARTVMYASADIEAWLNARRTAPDQND